MKIGKLKIQYGVYAPGQLFFGIKVLAKGRYIEFIFARLYINIWYTK